MARNLTTPILWFLLIIAGLVPQFTGYINGNSAWLLTAADKLVHGAKLGVDILETNPPLIIYINTLPVLLAELLGLDIIHGFILFIIIISLISLVMAFLLTEDNWVRTCIVFGLFVLPGQCFGEREHIFIILILPYFVSLWEDNKAGRGFNIAAGLMAGIGFNMKPYYLVILAALIIVRLIFHRKIRAAFNLENLIIIGCTLAYFGYLVFIERTYIFQIVPLLVKYYDAFDDNIYDVLKKALALAFVCHLAFWIVFFKDCKRLTLPIYLANAGNFASIVVIILQKKYWPNYIYPPYFFALLTNVLLIRAIKPDLKELWDKMITAASAFALFCLVFITVASEVKVAIRHSQASTGQLVDIINEHADNKPVYVFNFDLLPVFPVITYSKAIYAPFYGHLWLLHGIYYQRVSADGEVNYLPRDKRSPEEAALVKHVLDDFSKAPPKLVIIEEYKHATPPVNNYKFDFVEYFSQEPAFKAIWKNYHKLGSFNSWSVYENEGE